MCLVRVFVLVDTAGSKEYVTGGLVYSKDIVHMISTVSKVADKGTIGIVKIKIGPAVTLAPPDKLASALDKEGSAVFYVGVAPFLYYHMG